MWILVNPTRSETLYHWRKIEPVTMKANFINFWCVESEFMIKNWFHNWTSVLGCIWHIFGKFRLFLALFWKSWYSSNCQHHCQQGSVNLQQLVVASAEVLEKSQIFQKCAKCTLTLMSNYEINVSLQIQILHIKIEWNCHWLYFSSIIMSFGQSDPSACVVKSINLYW